MGKALIQCPRTIANIPESAIKPTANVVDCVSSNDDAGMVGVGFGRAYLADNSCVCDVAFAVMWDVVEHDQPHGVGPLNPLLIGFRRMLASTLAESEDLICVGFVPSDFVFGMPSELAVFKCLPSFVVKDWACNEQWECFVFVCDGVGGEFIVIDSVR